MPRGVGVRVPLSARFKILLVESEQVFLYSMPKSITLQLSPRLSADAEVYTSMAARQLGIRREDVALVRVVKRSIDARRSPVKVNLTLEIFIDQEPQPAPIHFD